MVLTDLDLSMMVSVPTSMRPIDLGSTLKRSKRPETAIADETKIQGEDHARRTVKSEGVDVLPVITARHVLLSQTNCVFAFRDTIKDFKVFFGDTLCAWVRWLASMIA